MHTVWKYPFDVQDDIVIEMPRGAEILHVDIQHGTPCLWARVDPDAPKVDRKFRLAGTGHKILSSGLTHVGSFLMMGGGLVFHLFEVKR